MTSRREKLDRLAESPGALAYEYQTDFHAADVLGKWANLGIGERTTETVSIAGRLSLIRRHGGLTFAVVRDRTGVRSGRLDSRSSTTSTGATGSVFPAS